METSLIILGSGQDGGTPQLGLPQSVSHPRLASSIAVVAKSGAVILFDASPDIRVQSHLLINSSIYPDDREVWLDGVFITHAHMGHYSGLVHFGPESSNADGVPLFATESVLSFLGTNEPWHSLFANDHLIAVPLDNSTASIDNEVSVTPIHVPHRDEFSDTVAFSVHIDGEPWLLYLPDIDGWDEWPEASEVLEEHDVALIDASFSDPSELPGRDLAAIRHPLVPDTIATFSNLAGDMRIILTHINHTNPLGDPTEAITRLALEADFEIAHDGMIVTRGIRP